MQETLPLPMARRWALHRAKALPRSFFEIQRFTRAGGAILRPIVFDKCEIASTYSGSANTKMLLALLGCSSGDSRFSPELTNELPVLTATYCFPATEYVIGYPVTGEPRFTSHSTLPVF